MKRMKGFTLIELIIVMAILAILMTAVIRMFKPIRETYVDATLIESQRTIQNGMTKYITESVRFSTDLGLYTKGEVSGASDAVAKFTDEYISKYNIDAANRTAVENKIKEQAEIIVIDHGQYTYNGKNYTGRLLRRKNIGTALPNNEPDGSNITDSPVRDNWRIAMGSAYYGNGSFTVSLSDGDTSNTNWGASDGIKVQVTSQAENNMRNTYTDPSTGETRQASAIVTNNGLIVCKNLESPINGMFDTTKFNSANATASGTKVYIVFLNNDNKREVEAVS